MTRTRPIARPLTPIPARPAVAPARALVMESEALEPRRMFAGWMPHGDGYGPPHRGFEYGLYADRSAQVTTEIVILPWGGRMSIVSDGRSTTASSVSPSSVSSANAAPDATPDTTAAPAAYSGDALYGRPGLPVTRPATDVAPADAALTPAASADSTVDAVARATPDAAPAGRRALSETHDQMAERVFGPFAIVDAPTVPAAPTGTGLASLLNAGRDRTDSLLRETLTASAARSRRAASADAELDAAPIVVVESPAAAEQASLATLVQGPSAQPLWQRLAVLTAGVTLAAANWVVRRRTRRTAATARPA